MKFVTGSIKVIEVLNKLGHCSNYDQAEELETELTYAACDSSTLIPYGLKRQQDLHTGIYKWESQQKQLLMSTNKEKLNSK
jgi:hypothetical protein